VGVARGEGDEDLEERCGEGEERVGVLILHVNILPLTIVTVKVFLTAWHVIEQTE
jgi:hypothetical protein